MHLIKKKKKKMRDVWRQEKQKRKNTNKFVCFLNYRQDVLLQANTDDIVACHLFAFFWFVIYIQHRG